MRFRTGLVAGFALGYYFGTKAGNERYRQIEDYLTQVRSSTTVRQLVTRLGELAEAGVARGRSSIEAGATYSPGIYDYQADPTLN
jgi:hypothetical protein